MVGPVMPPRPETRLAERPETRRGPSATLVIIPAYDEEAAIAATLAELGAQRPDLDVLVVSDGSTDKTAALARAAGAAVVELPFNLGIGGALQTGFRYAVRRGYVRAVQFDADGQHDPREIAALEAALDDGAELVIGNRFGDGNGDGDETTDDEYQVGPVRRTAMHVLRVAVNALSGHRFRDTSSGFRAFNAPVLEFFARSYPVEFMDSTEALLLASQAGYRVREVPARMRPRAAGRPSNRNVRLVYHYLRLLVVMVSQVSTRRGRAARRAS